MAENEDSRRGSPRPPGDKYDTWSWREVQNALTGGAAVGGQYRDRYDLDAIADPHTLYQAAQGFIDATEDIRAASDILTQGTQELLKHWKGPAAQAFCQLMLRVCDALEGTWTALAGGFSPKSLGQSLHDVGSCLEQGQHLLTELDRFYARQALELGAGTVKIHGEELVRISKFPQLVEFMTHDFRTVMKQVAQRYYLVNTQAIMPRRLAPPPQQQDPHKVIPVTPSTVPRSPLPSVRTPGGTRIPTRNAVVPRSSPPTGRASVMPSAMASPAGYAGGMPMGPMMPPMMPGAGAQGGNPQATVSGGRPVAQLFPGGPVEHTIPGGRPTAPGLTPVVSPKTADQADNDIPSRRDVASVYPAGGRPDALRADGASEPVPSAVGVAAVTPAGHAGVSDGAGGTSNGGHSTAQSSPVHEDEGGLAVVPLLFWRGRRRKDQAHREPARSVPGDSSLADGTAADTPPGHVIAAPTTPNFGAASGILRKPDSTGPAAHRRSPSERTGTPTQSLDLGQPGVLASSTSFTNPDDGSETRDASAGSIPPVARSDSKSGATGAVRFFSEEGARLRATGRAAPPQSFAAMVDDHEARAAASAAGEAAAGYPADAARAGADGNRGVFGGPDRQDRTDHAKDRLLTEDKTTWVNGDDMTQGVLGRPSDGK